MTDINQIALGDEVRCKVTGFKGVAVARSEHLNGCIRWTVQPPVDKDGKLHDAIWVDQVSLERVEKKIEHKPVQTGGPITKAERY